jgi:hypothetical protein
VIPPRNKRHPTTCRTRKAPYIDADQVIVNNGRKMHHLLLLQKIGFN